MKKMTRYLLILVAVVVLWNTVIIRPLKIFTVFLHELGHALMAVVFGHGISGFRVNLNESGYTIAQSKGWFSSFMIANGGYLGSILFALLIIYLSRTGFKKYILGTVAIALLAVTLRFSGPSFSLLYSVVFAVAVILLYMIQNERINEWVIDIIGISSIAYAVYDTFVDTILLQINRFFHVIKGWNGSRHMTDAMQLAEMTKIPAIIWGIIWLAIAFIAINAVLLKTPKAYKGRK
ncbi:MAG: M50 family metallopeptidase [Clostridia bacterium]|nr:M50 family metallopeptidase [Clostridia bacterium]